MHNPGTGKWDDPEIPKDGWLNDRSEERKKPCTCEMCGAVDKRYAKHFLYIMKHPTHREMKVCWECRDAMMRNLKSWISRKWGKSKKGNPQIHAEGHLVTLFPRGDGWSACMAPYHPFEGCGESTFLPTTHATQDGAKRAAFALWRKFNEKDRRRYEEWKVKRAAKLKAAKKWLLTYLADGPKEEVEIETEGEKRGLDYHLISEARDDISERVVKTWDSRSLTAWCLKSMAAAHNKVIEEAQEANERKREAEHARNVEAAKKWLPKFLANGPKTLEEIEKEGEKRGLDGYAVFYVISRLGVRLNEGKWVPPKKTVKA